MRVGPLNCRYRLVVAVVLTASGLASFTSVTPVWAVACPILATQGDLTVEIDIEGVDHVVHHFTSTGSAVFTPPATVTQVEYLVVGGGGGGGARYGGGGGGGGVRTGTLAVTPGIALNVTVGAGGTGGVRRNPGVALQGPGQNGGASVLDAVVAQGGGGGGAGAGSLAGNNVGRSGASGGGGGGGPLDQSTVTFAGGGATQGNAGGSGTYASATNYFPGLTAGGGGGAGGNGGAGDRRAGVGLAGVGGLGVTSTMSGTALEYGGGGGGGAFHVNLPNVGQGGGGNGTNTDTQPVKALRGGGGGGGGLSTQGWEGSAGGDGGDGVVLVRYATPPLAPCAPVITSVAAGDSRATVSFQDPVSDGGAIVTNYEFSSDGGVTWTAVSPPSVASPLVVGGLTNGTVAALAVRAVNGAGPGAASNMVEVTPQAPAPLLLPMDPIPDAPPPAGVIAPPVTDSTAAELPPVPVTSPSTTVAIPDTTAPLAPSGTTLVTRNGNPVDSMVLATETSSLSLLHGTTRIRVSARCTTMAACPPMVTSADGGLTVQVVSTADLQLRATGLQPGAPVSVWVFSDPTLLANSVLDSSGTYDGVIPMQEVPPGRHTLQVHSIEPSGDRLTFQLSLLVVTEPAALSIQLPRTGGSGMLAVASLIMSLLGAVVLGAVRRGGPWSPNVRVERREDTVISPGSPA